MTKTQAINQSNNQSDQNYDFDIDQIYLDFIQEIDANRSLINIQTNSSSLDTFDVNTIGSIAAGLKVENTVQESRAHAFYRLIGLPVIDQDGNAYNPGLDIMQESNTRRNMKVTIANNQDPQFKALSLQRENYANNILIPFNQTPPTITASALALSSSARSNTRSFSVPTTNTDALSFFPGDQKYTATYDGKVGKYDVLLNNYKDANGNLPDSSYLTGNRFHFIQPFIVDARIDFTVNPSSRLVAVPFVNNKKNLLVSENTYVKRPLIEKVIRDRVAATQNTTISSGQQDVINYIKNTSTLKNDTLIQKMVNSPYIQNNSELFTRYVFMIEAMCKKLVAAQQDIQMVQSKYYWIPLVSTSGPEGGSNVNPIIILSGMPIYLVTSQDQSIINLSLTKQVNDFLTSSAEASGTGDPGGFSFDGGTKFFSLTFDETTSSSLGDTVGDQLDSLNRNRDHDLGIANDALKTIEIIMGEWSGLGLCDIIAVMASLYTMDQNALFGLLDIDAQTRLATQLQVSTASSLSATAALNVLVSTVNDYYHLMDDTYKILANNNG